MRKTSLSSNNTSRLGIPVCFFVLILASVGLGPSYRVEDHLAALDSEDANARRKAIKELCSYLARGPETNEERTWDPEKFNSLIAGLTKLSYDKNSETREWTIRCLVSTTDARAVPPIARLLNDKSERVRAAAAGAFLTVTVGDADIIKRLETLLKDPKESVRKNAAMALGTNGTKRSLILLRRLEKAEKSREVKEIIADAIGRLQTKLSNH